METTVARGVCVALDVVEESGIVDAEDKEATAAAVAADDDDDVDATGIEGVGDTVD
jgi:hypothetical protein